MTVVHIVQCTIVQEAQLGVVVAKVAVPIFHVTVAVSAAVIRLWAHVSVMSLPHAQDAIVPPRAFVIDIICPIGLTLTAVEALLPMVEHMFVMLLLGHTSNGSIIKEGSTNSITITPCCSLSVAMVGTLVMMSLIMSLYGVISMATIVSSG
jgi:hypothetical protein